MYMCVYTGTYTPPCLAYAPETAEPFGFRNSDERLLLKKFCKVALEQVEHDISWGKQRSRAATYKQNCRPQQR